MDMLMIWMAYLFCQMEDTTSETLGILWPKAKETMSINRKISTMKENGIRINQLEEEL